MSSPSDNFREAERALQYARGRALLDRVARARASMTRSAVGSPVQREVVSPRFTPTLRRMATQSQEEMTQWVQEAADGLVALATSGVSLPTTPAQSRAVQANMVGLPRLARQSGVVSMETTGTITSGGGTTQVGEASETSEDATGVGEGGRYRTCV